jgi:ADP-heptose:LPS heptosyltransferase
MKEKKMIDERTPLKKEYMSFALEAGGSTYPEVNTRQLERFADLLIRECIIICQSGAHTQTTGNGAADMIRQRFGLLTTDEALDKMARLSDEMGLGLYDEIDYIKKR